jgi:hypothetical protein
MIVHRSVSSIVGATRYVMSASFFDENFISFDNALRLYGQFQPFYFSVLEVSVVGVF